MTIEQIITEILQTPKPYTFIQMPQSTFAAIISRIKAGTCKPKTAEAMLNRFGYFKVVEQWEKK